MNKEFVSYEQALALKELGFDEPCWAWWHIEDCDTRFCYSQQRSPIINSRETEIIGLPLYQQAFRWFREKHNYAGFIQLVEPEYGGDYGYVIYYKLNHLGVDHWNKGFKTYEEAEQACLDELIKIVKNGNTRN